MLGDLLYHGPRNDLPEGYDPKAVIAILSGLRSKILCVRGNCDAHVDQMVLPFPILSDNLLLYLDGHVALCCHGHQDLPELEPGSIVLTGHTHVPVLAREDGLIRLNPGSMALPKEGSAHSYMTYAEGVFTLKTVHGEAISSLSL